MRGKGGGKKEIDTEQYIHKKNKKQKRTNNSFCNTKKHPLSFGKKYRRKTVWYSIQLQVKIDSLWAVVFIIIGFSLFLTGRGCTLNLSLLQETRTRERTGSYLYTTELTSCFDKKSPDVRDSLLKYRQPVQDTRPRPCSMPVQSGFRKQQITATIGSEILKNFSSPDLSANRRKPTVSNKLIKSFRKKKPSMESFKSYVDLDLNSDDSGKDNLSAAVSEPTLRVAEPSSAANTMVESRTFDQGPLGTNGWSHCNGKSNSLPPGSVNISLTLQVPSEDSGASNQGRLSPEIPRMRRGQKKSPAKTLPMSSPNPKDPPNEFVWLQCSSKTRLTKESPVTSARVLFINYGWGWKETPFTKGEKANNGEWDSLMRVKQTRGVLLNLPAIRC